MLTLRKKKINYYYRLFFLFIFFYREYNLQIIHFNVKRFKILFLNVYLFIYDVNNCVIKEKKIKVNVNLKQSKNKTKIRFNLKNRLKTFFQESFQESLIKIFFFSL